MGGTGPAPLRPGVVYFSLVFAVGFFLGTIRVLAVVPLLGERAAELLEMPLMLLASFLAARWVARRFRIPSGARGRLPVGLVAGGPSPPGRRSSEKKFRKHRLDGSDLRPWWRVRT